MAVMQSRARFRLCVRYRVIACTMAYAWDVCTAKRARGLSGCPASACRDVSKDVFPFKARSLICASTREGGHVCSCIRTEKKHCLAVLVVQQRSDEMGRDRIRYCRQCHLCDIGSTQAESASVEATTAPWSKRMRGHAASKSTANCGSRRSMA